MIIRRIAECLILAAGLALPSAPLPDSEPGPDRYFGAADHGLLLRVEDDEGRAVYLSVDEVDARGSSRPLLRPLRLEPAAGNDRILEAAGPVRGKPETIRISFDRETAALVWLQPAQLKFADGTSAEIAGRYPRLSEADRRAAAEGHFALADKELDEVYRRLRERMPAGDFAELRLNQSLWLKFRDHFIADGDDMAENGPGSIPFRQGQTARTLERTAFLQALEKPPAGAGELGGRYSDGIDWVLFLDEDSTAGVRLFFTLQYSPSLRRGPEWPLPVAVSGVGTRNADGHSWSLAGKPAMENAAEPEDRLILMPSTDRRGLTVSGPEPAPFSVKLYRTAEPAPAEMTMRSILLRLPAEIFDETTEGLDEGGKAGLAWTGTSGPFRLEEPAADFLRVRYPEGQVEIRRFPGADGGAAIAVGTANLRARGFGLWRIPASGGAPRLWPLEQALPPLKGSDFYQEPEDASAASRGLIQYRLFPNLAEILASWAELADGPQADIDISLSWNGFGFEVVRN